jgi:hypothetical protein
VESLLAQSGGTERLVDQSAWAEADDLATSTVLIPGARLGPHRMCDWIDNAIVLQMGRSEAQIYGYIHLPCRVEVNSRVKREPLLEKRIG